ncbi:polyprenyl diphosphate synthase [Paenibacillus pini]|uniref:Isoprenyl transferase n=1 Tax=Paenibacillus pini JCM 16418 TaxID=1236976 RepID=W7YG22_9BACL|nr:polyprenyl diphosphate synthase [Paenibacillus pini]GAF09875.1 undecaprenyl diphosphate synthase [Paenibacillus pini JCM 16418]
MRLLDDFDKVDIGDYFDINGIMPEHVAIIMDGNSYWANIRELPPPSGYYAGMKNMKEMISIQINIKCLTLYAFTSNYLMNSKYATDYLIHLPKLFYEDGMINRFIHNNVRLRFIGNLDRYPKEIQEMILEPDSLSEGNEGMIVNFAIDYGGRSDIIEAMHRCISSKGFIIEDLTEEIFESYLYTNDCLAPDLLIRTIGEHQMSNLLLWQSSKSELWHTPTLWPDFNERLLYEAIGEFQKRRINMR